MWYTPYCEVISVTQGERIKMLREEKHMTIAEVGRRIGVGRSTAYKYETGAIAKIPDDKVEALAQLFGVSEQFLKGWSDKREESAVETVGVPFPDGEKFIQAYSYMTYDERVQLTNLVTAGYDRYLLANDGYKKKEE